MNSTAIAIGRILVIGLALGAGCGGSEGAAFDLPLVVDRNVNAPQQLVSLVGTLRVVVDSPEGLYPADAARDAGSLKLEDVDADGAVELWTDVDVVKLGRLPRVRIEQGGLGSVSLDLRFEGRSRDDGRTVAAGGLRGLRFEDGQREVEVPFNLKQRYRPPQVTQVIPAEGAEVGDVGSVFIVFPKRMDAESLRAPGAIELRRQGEPGQGSTVPATGTFVPATGTFVPATGIFVQFLPGDESPTTAEYRLDGSLAVGSYRLIVTTAVRDTDGRPLDQVPMQPENQGFSSTFTVDADMSVEATAQQACDPEGCADPTGPCHLGGERCPDGMRCQERACVPDGCAAGCAAGAYVCDPTAAICVTDCRIYGSHGGCPTERPTCGADGVCLP